MLLTEHEQTPAGEEPASRKPWEQDGVDKVTLGKTTNNFLPRLLPLTCWTWPRLHWQEPQQRQKPGSHKPAADPTLPHPGEGAWKLKLQTEAVSMA